MKIAVVDDDRSAFELLKTQISQLLTDRTDIVWFSSGNSVYGEAFARNTRRNESLADAMFKAAAAVAFSYKTV